MRQRRLTLRWAVLFGCACALVFPRTAAGVTSFRASSASADAAARAGFLAEGSLAEAPSEGEEARDDRAAEVAGNATLQDDPDGCNPPCKVGRGICVSKVCFCKNPYTGIRCDRKLQTGMARISHTLVIALATLASVAGMAMSSFVYKGFSATHRKVEALHAQQSEGPKKETWKLQQKK
eukprot:TRINITY_DN63512_c0_g1_i1.p1 TRINITY_DN63512_c0_g1~~TRINITY_DN63512_c0_g1_i1.p1  ORF type:complete len:179 (-),score=38.49 TRINITY_DN63512_c0_g1_i1:121-657(-)